MLTYQISSSKQAQHKIRKAASFQIAQKPARRRIMSHDREVKSSKEIGYLRALSPKVAQTNFFSRRASPTKRMLAQNEDFSIFLCGSQEERNREELSPLNLKASHPDKNSAVCTQKSGRGRLQGKVTPKSINMTPKM